MTVNRWLRLIAGSFVFASAVLAAFHSPYWLLFTGFVGLNLAQSARVYHSRVNRTWGEPNRLR